MNGEGKRKKGQNGEVPQKSFDIRDLLIRQKAEQQSKEHTTEINASREPALILEDDTLYESAATPRSLLNDEGFQTIEEIKQDIKSEQDVPITIKSPLDKMTNKIKRQRQVENYRERHTKEIRDERSQRAHMRGVKRSSSPVDCVEFTKKKVKFDLPDEISTDEDDDGDEDDEDDDEDNE